MVFTLAPTEAFGIQALRRNVGVTQEQAARTLDIAVSTVRNWEAGRTTPTLTFTQTRILMELYQASITELENAFAETLTRTRNPE
ncbi:helix-turn-helix domain-containing protein [Anthocerotibacter panamensis]|uniref:helix-turn-helix domain-containing protein n=1 Tax=Anthocerotibacter panamensis TaxID=2857077 RepID=UPI001C4028BC|nr:helix-turn-helix domain-containing protein [Anthocerotibacter panamensis]